MIPTIQKDKWESKKITSNKKNGKSLAKKYLMNDVANISSYGGFFFLPNFFFCARYINGFCIVEREISSKLYFVLVILLCYKNHLSFSLFNWVKYTLKLSKRNMSFPQFKYIKCHL